MAITVSNERSPGWTSRPVAATIAFDASYPTGGEALTPNQLGLEVVDHVFIAPSGGYVFEYDYANELVIAYESGTASAPLDEVDNTDDLSALTDVHVLAFGT